MTQVESYCVRAEATRRYSDTSDKEQHARIVQRGDHGRRWADIPNRISLLSGCWHLTFDVQGSFVLLNNVDFEE